MEPPVRVMVTGEGSVRVVSFRSFLQSAEPLPHRRLSLDMDNMGVVYQAVDHRVGNSPLAELRMPCSCAELRAFRHRCQQLPERYRYRKVRRTSNSAPKRRCCSFPRLRPSFASGEARPLRFHTDCDYLSPGIETPRSRQARLTQLVNHLQYLE